MSEVLQTNVFFFIASVAVVAFTVLLCIMLYQVIKILGSVRNIVDRLEEGSEAVAHNLKQLRDHVSDMSFLKSIVGSIFGLRSYEKKRTRPAARPPARDARAGGTGTGKPRKKNDVEENIDNDNETT